MAIPPFCLKRLIIRPGTWEEKEVRGWEEKIPSSSSSLDEGIGRVVVGGLLMIRAVGGISS
jgi:hypothetical protein